MCGIVGTASRCFQTDADTKFKKVSSDTWRSLEIEGKLSPAQFGLIRRSLNATHNTFDKLV